MPGSELSPLRDLYVPPTVDVDDDAPIRHFSDGDLQRSSKIFETLRKGAMVVLEGKEAAVSQVAAYVHKKRGELLGRAAGQAKGRQALREQQRALDRLGVLATPDHALRLDPPRKIPHLLELLGGVPTDAEQRFVFVPWFRLQALSECLVEQQEVEALGFALVSAPNVLVPRSQETTDCFAEALQAVVDEGTLLTSPRVLDMGCGSGCLTLLAAKLLAPLRPHLSAADLLPEALACTKNNLERALLLREHPLGEALHEASSVAVIGPTDLYEMLGDEVFDLVLFNAPWVDADVRSRSEVALNDPGRETLQRFLAQSKERLSPRGRILLGYADGGQRSGVVEAEEHAGAAGLRVHALHKRRVATHRKNNKWQNNVVLTLGHG